MAGEPKEAVLLREVRTLFALGVVRGSTDGQLLERFLGADHAAAEAAFTILVERHGAMVMHVCRQVLDNPDDAQDAFQATFLVLLRRAGSIRNRESVASWLFGVALRVSRRARYAAVVRRFHERQGGSLATAQARGEGESSECRAALHEEIARLPDRYREALVLCHLEGLSTAVAAQRLGCAHGTILSRLARARERLRRRLTGRGLTVPAGLFLANLVPRDAAASVAGRAALTATVSPAVTALTRTTLRSFLMTRLTLVAAALATAAALTAVAVPFVRTTRGAASPAAGREPQPPAQGPRPGGPGIPGRPVGEVIVAMDSDTSLSAAYSPDGKTLVAAGCQGAIDLWDVVNNQKIGSFKGERSIVRHVAFAPDGKTLASVGDEGIVRLWEPATGTLKQTFPAPSESLRQSVRQPSSGPVAFAPDGHRLAISAWGEGTESGPSKYIYEVRVIDSESGRLVWSHLGRGEWVFSLAFAPDGNTLASAGFRAVKLWDAPTGEPLRTLKPDRGGIYDVAFSPDGRMVAGGTRFDGDGDRQPAELMTLWDVATGEVLHTLEGQTGVVRAVGVAPVAFSPDGKTIAMGGAGHSRNFGNVTRALSDVRLWEIATGKLLWAFEGELGEVNSLAFSPDGRMLVYCDMQSVGMIDAQTGRIERILKTTTMTPRR
jgi:RNA polymerase sigma factor (sigma-70 family)